MHGQAACEVSWPEGQQDALPFAFVVCMVSSGSAGCAHDYAADCPYGKADLFDTRMYAKHASVF